MKKINTSDLILNLSMELTPTPWYKRPASVVIIWLLFALIYFPWVLYSVFGVSLQNFGRFDLDFMISSILLLGAGPLGGAIVLRLSLPGKNLKFLRWTIVSLLIFWLAAILSLYPIQSSQIARHGFDYQHGDWGCSRYIFFITAAPTIVLLFCVRSLAPTRPRWLAAHALLASAAGATLCLEFLCINKSIVHMVYGHYAAILALGLVGLLAGKRLLKW